jgi:hypothetical protein
MEYEKIFNLSEKQILDIIELSRGGSYYVEYINEKPHAGIDWDYQPEEIINELKKKNI